MKLQPYPVYKDSGVAWLGKVPEHWQIQRGKWLFRKMERPIRDQDDVITCFRDGTVTLRRNRRTQGFTESLKEIGYQGIRKGDLVIHAMDGFAGAIGVSDSDGKGSPVYAVCRPEDRVNSYFYAYLLREMARTQWIAALAKGIRERSTDFRFATFAGQELPFPPLSEQTSIVHFLNHADRRIQRYIHAKQKLIKLLEEQKQAIIHRAVTRGLDPKVRFKPSGVPWLGEVPEHWEVRRLRSLAHIKTGGRDTVDRVDDGKYPFFVRSQTIERINSWSFDGEAVLTAGDGAGVAKVFHYVNGRFEYHQRVYKFSEFRDISGKFFFEYFRATLKFEALAGNAKSTVDSLRQPMLQNFPVVVPPKGEQAEIVGYLSEVSASIDNATGHASDEIALLREYRTRLIADVITGKLDVREAATQLPEELEERELIDEMDEIADTGGDKVDDFEEELVEAVI